MITQEYARNKTIEGPVLCAGCEKIFPIEDMLQSEPLPDPYAQTVRVFLRCPGCGKESHCYYLPEYLQFVQEQLKIAVQKWNTSRAAEDYTEYARLQRSFQNKFDKAQRDYTRIVARDILKEGPGHGGV